MKSLCCTGDPGEHHQMATLNGCTWICPMVESWITVCIHTMVILRFVRNDNGQCIRICIDSQHGIIRVYIYIILLYFNYIMIIMVGGL